jgi:hypothetical protein
VNRTTRAILITVLILAGAGCFYLYFQRQFSARKTQIPTPQPLLDLTFELNSGTGREPHDVKKIEITRTGFYEIKLLGTRLIGGEVDHYTYPLEIKFAHDVSLTTDKSQILDTPFYIDQSGPLTIHFKSRYVSNIKTKLRVRELGQNPPENFGLILSPKDYNSFKLPALRGATFEIKETPAELVSIGIFQNNNLADSFTFPQDKLYQDSSRKAQNAQTNYEIVWEVWHGGVWGLDWKKQRAWIHFYDDFYLQFKALEVPYFFKTTRPHFEQLLINRQPHGGAQYLQDGQVTTTKVWLDQGDRVELKTGSFYLATENERWRIDKDYSLCQTPGFLRVKARGKAKLNSIEVKRSAGWEFRLQPGQNQPQNVQIKVYPQDQVSITASSRYYLNDQMQEKDTAIHTFHSEQNLTFKGSVQPALITVRVLKRRGI